MAKKKSNKKKSKKQEVAPINAYDEAIKFASDAFRSGKSEKYISELLQSAYPIFTIENINFIINRGSQIIAQQYARDRNSIVTVHVRRYNDEIDKLMKYVEVIKSEKTKMAPHKKRPLIIDSLENVVAILFAKEKVLQLHGKDTQIKVFNKLNAKIRERKVGYDLSALSFEEKLEFLNLVMKAKKSVNEIFSIQMRPKEEVVKTEDAEFEVVENNNIEKIKKINIPEPPPEPHPIDKLKEKTSSPIDVMNKLQQALKKKAEQEFKKAKQK